MNHCAVQYLSADDEMMEKVPMAEETSEALERVFEATKTPRSFSTDIQNCESDEDAFNYKSPPSSNDHRTHEESSRRQTMGPNNFVGR